MTTSLPRPSTPCAEPGCYELANGGPRCPEHQQQRDHEHNAKRAKTYHGYGWKRARATAIKRQHGCLLAHIDNCRGPLHVHHENGDSTDNRQGNLVVLCERHHMRLEREPAGNGPLSRALRDARAAIR